MRVKPQPTKRAVIDVGRKCNINCKFCYYHHLGDLTKQSFHPVNELIDKIDYAIDRGNNYIDFTGGEPSIMPEMPEILKYCYRSKLGTCIITNGIVGEGRVGKLLNSHVDGFLVSIHGTEKTHDFLTFNGARKSQLRFLKQIKDSDSELRFNLTLNSFNQKNLIDTVKFAVQYQPAIFNFINFNPHGDWGGDLKGTAKTAANLRIVQKQLSEAIRILENEGVGVNIRYYPMCRIDKKYRRCICNDLHVTFDPYEWDYEIQPKNYSSHRQWGMQTSNNIEWKLYPCNFCDLKNVCGGINKAFNCATFGEYTDTVKEPELKDKNDFYFYRQDNIMTLQERSPKWNMTS